MLTIIILAVLSIIIGVLIFKEQSNKPEPQSVFEEAVVPTIEEEPLGYETGSLDLTPSEKPIAIKKQLKKKSSPKSPKIDTKPKKLKNKLYV